MMESDINKKSLQIPKRLPEVVIRRRNSDNTMAIRTKDTRTNSYVQNTAQKTKDAQQELRKNHGCVDSVPPEGSSLWSAV
jgi:hypothetical protein